MLNLTLKLHIQVGLIEVDAIRVNHDPAAFEELLACGQRYAEQYAQSPISAVPGIQAARQLFRSLGIEPTKHRPASEALLRRFLKSQEINSVNNVVDVSNWCALDFLLPNGIYDRTKLAGDIELRKGLPGESYLGLNNLEVHLEDRYALADALGPFGSPKTDSRRTCVDIQTRSVIAVMYAPLEYDRDLLQKQCDFYADRLVQYCRGSVEICRLFEHPG